MKKIVYKSIFIQFLVKKIFDNEFTGSAEDNKLKDQQISPETV